METVTRYNKNNVVLKNDNIYYLFSYDTKVLKYDRKNDKLTLFKNWNYSTTTLKYVYRFINFYFYDLTTFKDKKSVIKNMIDNKKIEFLEG